MCVHSKTFLCLKIKLLNWKKGLILADNNQTINSKKRKKKEIIAVILLCPNSNRGQVFIWAVGEIKVDESFHISNSSYFIWVQMLPSELH